ncbi:gp53-like domain-containing protein [Xanthomonas sontii]|uniref:gp53-like domain-containing protein n=1 Tax=Xanthomonas sontii TaxID=2650745 RepID=UPI003F839858
MFFDLLGIEPAAGGSLTFYAQGTTTPKGTWSDSELTIANTNPVQLDSSGRANVNIWCDGAYTVILKDADGTSIWTRDFDSGQGGGATIPALDNGKFLTNDGSNLLWSTVLQVPDPTGAGGKILGTDGSNLIWQAAPTIPSLPIVNSTSSDKIGTLLIQYGSASAPASGNRQTAVSVTFPVAYDQPAFVVIPIVRNDTHTSGQQIAVPAEPVKTATGFSLRFDTDDFGQSNANIISAVNFDWIAFGRKA